MRFIITAHPGPDSTVHDPAAPFDEQLFTAYMAFNEEMHRAGVLVASEGLNPAGKGAMVVAKGGRRTVVDGPFTETKELVGGFYVIEVASLDEAIAWVKRVPNPAGGGECEIELRRVHEAEDFAACDPTGELRACEAQLRDRLSARA